MKVYLGADHRGIIQKGKVEEWLGRQGIEYEYLGARSYDAEDDYNDYALEVARRVVQDPEARGILMCGSGHGVCMQANRLRGVRAINGLTPELAEIGRRHNDANVLCLAVDFVPEPDDVLTAFFKTEFEGIEKYIRRNRELDEEVM